MGADLPLYPAILLGITDDCIELVKSFLAGYDYKPIEYSFYQFSPEYIARAFICMAAAFVFAPVIQGWVAGFSCCG